MKGFLRKKEQLKLILERVCHAESEQEASDIAITFKDFPINLTLRFARELYPVLSQIESGKYKQLHKLMEEIGFQLYESKGSDENEEDNVDEEEDDDENDESQNIHKSSQDEEEEEEKDESEPEPPSRKRNREQEICADIPSLVLYRDSFSDPAHQGLLEKLIDGESQGQSLQEMRDFILPLARVIPFITENDKQLRDILTELVRYVQ
jgi:cobalamin biosynthesis protein CobT